VKKSIIIALTITALAVIGCKDKPSTKQASGPQNGAAGREAQPSASHGATGPAAADPHAGMKPHAMPTGPDHKGRVVSTMDAAGYTYIEVEEQGKKLWVAVTRVNVKAGDEVEFPDSSPMENFQSKTLNRTFDKIIFSPALRINGKPAEMGAHPKSG
jgi:hypothetical protein